MSDTLLAERLTHALSSRHDRPVLRQDERGWNGPQLLDAACALGEGLGAGRVVAVLADNGPAWAIADLAILLRGAVQLPLPGFFSPAQWLHALEQSGCDTVLTDQPEKIMALAPAFSVTGQRQGLALLQRRCDAVSLPPGTAKISFTSGSTGQPKGVCLAAAGLYATAAAVAERLADLPLARHLAVLPLALLLENVAGLYAPWLLGSEVQLPGLATLGWRGMAGFDPAALQAVADRTQANSVILVPELLKAWALYLQATRQQAPAGLVMAAVGGAQVSPQLLAGARAAGIPAYQGYGLTECGSVVSLNRPGEDDPTIDTPSVGRPLGHMQVAIEDGEVVVTSCAFLGYLGYPGDVTAPGHLAGLAPFPTGDLGRFDDCGHLHLSGRRKHLLITSYGRNIAPEWVEAALLAQPAIAQAVVTGDARPWLSAVIVPAGDQGNESIRNAIAAANAGLPDYARIGGWISAAAFTPLNGLATGNGRPVRQAILDRHAAALAALYSQEEAPHEVL